MNSFNPSYSTQKFFKQNDLIIRQSIDSDLEKMIEIMYLIYNELCPRLTSWYNKNPKAFGIEFYGPKEQDPNKRVFYTIENLFGGLVGCGGLIQKNPLKEPEVGEISDIFLLKEYRRKELGKTLVKELITKARIIGFNKLFLTTRKEFVAATNLYQKLGFKQVENKKYRSNNSTAWELNLIS